MRGPLNSTTPISDGMPIGNIASQQSHVGISDSGSGFSGAASTGRSGTQYSSFSDCLRARQPYSRLRKGYEGPCPSRTLYYKWPAFNLPRYQLARQVSASMCCQPIGCETLFLSILSTVRIFFYPVLTRASCRINCYLMATLWMTAVGLCRRLHSWEVIDSIVSTSLCTQLLFNREAAR